MLRSAITLLFAVVCVGLVSAAVAPMRRPRQFRMTIYSEPNHQGQVQYIKATNGAMTPCWNLTNTDVGSYEMNDPFVNVTFYQSVNCNGTVIATYPHHEKGETTQNRVMIEAASVSVVKVD
ncbi:hypothetical protein BDF20DRAFT_834873 [Mycotypha africana]|uniref:uncharacterized protein n=1 Tax=Mycotypha africana TaxID=64632 RepID=UPI0023012141|nr:uncharacterized protein BDF20DRAFT_834873 [Mycotypha africana]KAI8982234.1 hypothetical protein BDF20DRAFT_834873 [Mycotypha africana]